MIAIFKRNDISPVIALLCVTVVVKWHSLTHPPKIETLSLFQQGMLYSWHGLQNFYSQHPSTSIFITILIQLAFALYLNFGMNQERLFGKKSYFPALSFILLTSWFPSFNVLSMAFIANMILFFAFAQALQLYHLQDARKACFNIGFMVAVSTIFYFPAVLGVVLLLLILLLLRPFVLQEIAAYLFGILGVYYLVAGMIYVFGNLRRVVNHISFHFELPVDVLSPKASILATSVSIAILIYGIYLINQTGEQSTMAARKKWNAVFFYSFFGVLMGIFSIVFPTYTWIFAITPFSILLSQSFQNKQEKYNIFTFYFLLGVILFSQWFLT